jgi:flagellar protein FliO/FliZ
MPTSSILLALCSLVGVLGLILVAGRVARRVASAGFLTLKPRLPGGDRIALVQVLALDPRRRLHLVRCDGRHVVLLTGGGDDLVVGWLDGPPAAAEPAP